MTIASLRRRITALEAKAKRRAQESQQKSQQITRLQALLSECDQAIAFYLRSAEIARRGAEEQRQRRLALEEEFDFVRRYRTEEEAAES